MFLPVSDMSAGRARALICFGILLLVLGTNATLVKLFGEERAGFDREAFIEEGIDPGVHGVDYNEDMQQSRGGGTKVDEPQEPLLKGHFRRRHGSRGGGADKDDAHAKSGEELEDLIHTLGEVVDADKELENTMRDTSKKSSKNNNRGRMTGKTTTPVARGKTERAKGSPPALDEYIENTIRRDESLLESVEKALKEFEGGRERQAALDRPGQLSEAQELELKQMGASLSAAVPNMSKASAKAEHQTDSSMSDNVQQSNDNNSS